MIFSPEKTLLKYKMLPSKREKDLLKAGLFGTGDPYKKETGHTVLIGSNSKNIFINARKASK